MADGFPILFLIRIRGVRHFHISSVHRRLRAQIGRTRTGPRRRIRYTHWLTFNGV
jgi:hypothetical protein